MEDNMNLFRHKTSIQVRFKDIDALGHVNNANHLTYFELARVKYFDDVVNEKVDWSKQGIILARMEIDYRMPILLTDNVWVYCRVNRFGSKSFEMEYLIIKDENGKQTILASGKSVQVCFNYETNQTIAVPETWKQRALKFESL